MQRLRKQAAPTQQGEASVSITSLRVMIAPADFLPLLRCSKLLNGWRRPKRRLSLLVERRNFAIENNAFGRQQFQGIQQFDGNRIPLIPWHNRTFFPSLRFCLPMSVCSTRARSRLPHWSYNGHIKPVFPRVEKCGRHSETVRGLVAPRRSLLNAGASLCLPQGNLGV